MISELIPLKFKKVKAPRVASYVSQMAIKFPCKVTVNGEDAKQLLALLENDVFWKPSVSLVCDGEKEQECFNALKEILGGTVV